MRTSPIDHGGLPAAPYGPPEAGIRLVETFGDLESEYAALRKSAILLDQPHRGTLEITGADRIPFLNRMLTQELKDLAPWELKRSFWLNRKGRIDADMRLVETGSRMLVDLDIHAIDRTIKGLAAYIITEDVQVTDVSESWHRLALHGPKALSILNLDLAPDRARETDGIIAFRDDTTADPGIELLIPSASAAATYSRLATAGAKPAGWHAFNIARIEGGTPLYNIDFGPDSLPHETGILHSCVNFKKGCYLGQEIVARMESRGHSKRSLIAFKCDIADDSLPAGERPLPAAGAEVWSNPDGEPVGTITSSTLSPILAWTPIGFAPIKPEARSPGTKLLIATESGRVPATVHPTLQFWRRPSP